MRFRWKLLILLLSISIIPIMVLRTFGVGTIRRLGDELGRAAVVSRLAQGEKSLRLLVDSYSRELDSVGGHLVMAVKLQAMEVNRVLGGEYDTPSEIILPEHFDREETLPLDAFHSSTHFRRQDTGYLEFLQVAYSNPVFAAAPGYPREDFHEHVAALAVVTPVYRSIAESLAGVVSWHFTALDNGLLSAYPAHGGLPEDLDPRKEPWFRPDAEKEEWTMPYMDPVTGQMVITISMPVKGAGGVRGSTALVVPISSILDLNFLGRNITPRTQPFVGYIPSDGGEREIRIVASREYADGTGLDGREWVGERVLASSDRRELAAMMDDMEMGKRNIRKMPFEGRQSIWVYGKANPVNLILITPLDEVISSAMGVRDRINTLVDRMISFTGMLMLGLLMLVVFLAFSFSKRVTRHLSALAEGANRLGSGDFDARVDIGTSDEFGDLGRVFNSLVPRLREHSRLRRSMDLAREVQQRLLPSGNPRVEGADIAGTGIYCDETGGDYYDFIDFDENGKIGVIVGDVSGHGVSSALLMATARALLRQCPCLPGENAEIISHVNRELSKDVKDSGNFITLFYAVLDLHKRTVNWIRAGHDPAICYYPDGDRFRELKGKGVPLGVLADVPYEEHTKEILPGEIIVIGTDGIWEARNREGAMFGKEPLRRIIRAGARGSAQGILKTAVSELESFVTPVGFQDDVTLVVIKIGEPRKNPV